jgi:hypothetical protein
MDIAAVLPFNIAGFIFLDSVHATNPDYVQSLLTGGYELIITDSLFSPLGPYLAQRAHIPYVIFYVPQVHPDTAYNRAFGQPVSATMPLYVLNEW